MEITILFILILILIIIIALIVLTIFEGKTNKKVLSVLEELHELRAELKQRQQSDLKNNLDTSLSHNQITDSQNKQHTTDSGTGEKKSAKKIFDRLKEKVVSPESERFVGSYIIEIIGIIFLAVGLSFFVKYTISKEWINIIGKVSIGILSSGALIAFAHFSRNRFRVFSSVLLGGAMAILYYVFALAFYRHGLIEQPVAFLVFLAITAFSIFLSISYDRQEPAIIATLAAVTAPLLAGFDVSNYTLLFSYILIIDVGMLVLAFFKKWIFTGLITYAFTGIFYIIWITTAFNSGKDISFTGSFVFLTIFYFVFFVTNIINNIRFERKFIPIELSIIISLTVLYYSAGFVIVEEISSNLKGLFTALIAVFNLCYVFILYRNKKVDRNLLFLLIGLVLIFTTLIPPVQLVGKSITLVWSLQIVLLLWLAQKINVTLMKLGSAAITLFMLISLGIDMWETYAIASNLAEPMPMFLNIGFITNIIAVGALSLNVVLLGKETNEYYVPFLKVAFYRIFLIVCIGVAVYFTFFLEIKYHTIQNHDNQNVVDLFTGIYNYVFILLLMLPSIFIKQKPVALGCSVLGLTGVFFYMLFYHYLIVSIRNDYLTNGEPSLSVFSIHYVIVFLVIAIITIGQRGMIVNFGASKLAGKISLWLTVLLILFILCSELDTIYITANFEIGILPSELLIKSHRLPYTLLWSGMALVLIFMGLLCCIPELRIISFVLILATLIKLFAFDLKRMNRSEQIIAYIATGAILIIVSFIYQRIKKPVNKKSLHL